jgi:hypothetical protein
MDKKAITLIVILFVSICAALILSFVHWDNFSGIDGFTPEKGNTAVSSNSLSTEPITTNAEFIKTVSAAMGGISSPEADKRVISNIQGRIASLNTPNARTLLSEMGNPNNTENPRKFLEYMNWFASNYPIDAK